MQGTDRRSSGFTMVELLVVIGIIAALIAILLPALKGARDSAKRTQCLSNLRQIGIGVMTYAADSKGLIPYTQQWDDDIVYTNNGHDPARDDRPTLLSLVNDYHVFYCPFSYDTLDPADPSGVGWNGAITGQAPTHILHVPTLWSASGCLRRRSSTTTGHPPPIPNLPCFRLSKAEQPPSEDGRFSSRERGDRDGRAVHL